MERRKGSAWAEMCGAVIGAGFASGREVAAFFASYGRWSWLGIAVAVGTMGLLCRKVMRFSCYQRMTDACQTNWQGKLWRGASAALMLSAGGAMLAGCGEVVALMLPWHGVQAMGVVGSVAAAWVLTRTDNPWLGKISQGLVLMLVIMTAAGLLLPAQSAAVMEKDGRLAGLSGLCYGGFNMVLAAPVIAAIGQRLLPKARGHTIMGFLGVTGMLLCLGNAVLLRHGAFLGEELPLIQLLRPMGMVGYGLGGIALYGASLTTLSACLKGLRLLWPSAGRMCLAGVLLMSLAGLEAMVGWVYPVLGGCSLLLLLVQRDGK